MATNAPDFIRWSSRITTAKTFMLLPDGCHDVLIRRTKGGHHIGLTSLDMRPRQVKLMPGDDLIGYRLRPGLKVDIKGLDATDIAQAITDANETQDDVTQAVHALGTSHRSAQYVAKALGVSLRTLQRFLAKHDLPPPEFWRLLGRARRAAIALGSNLPLAEIAADHGYSDQSHMTRACQYWFHRTPAFLRQNKPILDDISQPALGTWRTL